MNPTTLNNQDNTNYNQTLNLFKFLCLFKNPYVNILCINIKTNHEIFISFNIYKKYFVGFISVSLLKFSKPKIYR